MDAKLFTPVVFDLLFLCYSFVFFILMVRITAFRIILLFICPAISYLLYLLNVFKLPWNIDSALMGVLFLWGGYLIRKFDIFSFVKSHKVVTIISGPVLAILGFCCIKFNCCIVSFDDNKYGHFFLMLFGALFWSALLFLAFYNIPKKILRYISILTIFGRNTIIIMGIDYLCGSIVSLFILQYCNKWYWLFILKIVLIGIIVIPWSKTKEKRKSIKL